MRSQAMHFVPRAAAKAADRRLQQNLQKSRPLFVGKRRAAFEQLADEGLDFANLRATSRNLRERVLADFDVWLEIFEERAQAAGAEVLWARDGAEAAQLVVDLALRHGAQKVVKTKSMLSEETAVNAALAAANIASIETDLGEYILQLAGETPSHILAPAIHKSRDEVADLFALHHGKPKLDEIGELTREARAMLREHFLAADMGISGANFLIAETGSAALVTNEGNGRMVTTLPQLHVVVAGIEKVLPTLEDMSTLLRNLVRSATGQPISNYVSLLTGPARAEDGEGPQKMVFVLVDNGRSALLGTPYQDMLRCIRCGACINHCPVYHSIGGHAYGWVYPGPMGTVLTPLFTSLAEARELPQASTGCAQCSAVCPVEIPLAELIHQLRRDSVAQGLRPGTERLALRLWGWLAGRPALYRAARRMAGWGAQFFADQRGNLQPRWLVSGWMTSRELPAPARRGFHELLAARKAKIADAKK